MKIENEHTELYRAQIDPIFFIETLQERHPEIHSKLDYEEIGAIVMLVNALSYETTLKGIWQRSREDEQHRWDLAITSLNVVHIEDDLDRIEATNNDTKLRLEDLATRNDAFYKSNEALRAENRGLREQLEGLSDAAAGPRKGKK